MITVNTMINKVRNKTQEINEKFLTNEYIVEFLDDGLSDVLSTINIRYETLLHKVSEPIDIVAGTKEYNMPLYMASGRIQQIRILDNDEWVQLVEKDINDEVPLLNLNPAFPYYYIVKGDKFSLYPTPDTNISEGMVITYTERLSRLDKSMGEITNIIGNKLYLANMDVYYTDGSVRLSVNDYISITGVKRAETDYNFRVKDINVTDSYIEIFTGITGVTNSVTDETNGFFTLSGADLTNVVSGDILVLTGSASNDGTYTIIGVDTSLYNVYVKETIPVGSNVPDGTVSIYLPEWDILSSTGSYLDKTIYTQSKLLNKGDIVASFNKSASVRLPDIAQDYIIAYAIKAAFEKAQEPNQEALLNLQRLAQAIETLPADRVAELKYRFRGRRL